MLAVLRGRQGGCGPLVMGLPEAEAGGNGCRVIDDNHVSVNGKQITIVSNRDPTKLPWGDMVSALPSV